MDAQSRMSSTARWMHGWTRRWLRGLSLPLATLALTACASGTTRTVVQPPPAASQLPLPAISPSLLQACAALPLARSGSLPDLEKNHLQVTALYHDCAARHQQTIKAVQLQQAVEARRAAAEHPPAPAASS